MRLSVFLIPGLVAGMLSVACSDASDSSSIEDGDAGGSGSEGGAGDAGEVSGFVPLPRAQPTEEGAWVVDPDDPSTLYALGERSMRSRDGGRSWAELAWPAGARSLGIAREPQRALFLRTSDLSGANPDRLFESTDDGESWTDKNTNVPSGDIVVVDGPDGAVLLAAYEYRVVRSSDRGETWAPLDLPSAYDAIPFGTARILVGSGGSSTVYFESAYHDDQLLVSTDAGATFAAKSLPATTRTFSLDCRGRLYAVDLDGITVSRSSDAGTSWEPFVELDEPSYYFHVLSAPPTACAERVYAAGEVSGRPKLWRLEDDSIESRDLPDWGELLDLGDERLLSISAFGLRQRSDDGGASWWTAGVQLDAGELVVDPSRPGSLFVSSSRSVYHSEDDGATWQKGADARTALYDLHLDAYDTDVLYARSIYGDDRPWSFVSHDRGMSFEDWPVPSAAAPEIPEALLSTAPGEVTVVTRKGAYVTRDAGAHFTALLTLPAAKQVMWATIANTEPLSIYAYVGGDDYADELLGSVDGGATWSSTDPGTYVDSLTVDPTDSRVVFARPGVSGDEDGLLRTLNAGRTWDRVRIESQSYLSVYFDPQPPHLLYAAGKRLYKSEDHGDTWQTVTELPKDTRNLQLAPRPGKERYVLGHRGLLYKMRE